MEYSEESLLEIKVADLMDAHDARELLGLASGLQEGGRILDLERTLKKARGGSVPMRLHLVRSEGCTLLVGIDEDAERNGETILALKKAKAESEQAYRAKSQFISIISHELRTPLNAVLGYAALLEDRFKDDPRASSYLSSIHGSGTILRDLINNILDHSRAESGKLVLNPEPMDPRNLLAELAEVFALEAQRKGVALSFNASDGMPSKLLLDQSRIKQIMLNLTGNSVKFTSAGSVSVSFDYRLPKDGPAAAPGKSYKATVLIRIVDTGIGMTEEYRARLFEPFSQQDPSIARSYGGSGLGLSIAKRLLDLMDASIRCSSEVGKGTAFEIELPSVTSSGNEKAFSLWISKQ
jgi:signal transduction histidine kinase